MRGRPFKESLYFAWAGLVWAYRSQQNLRRHSLVAVAVLVMSHILDLTRLERAVVVTMIAFVIGAELMNTVVEVIVDLCTTQYHPLAKRAKDVAAAFVLMAAFAAAVVGLYLLGPPLVRLVGQYRHSFP